MTALKDTYGALAKGERLFFAAYAVYFVALLALIQFLQFSGESVFVYGKPMYLISLSNLFIMLWIYVKFGRGSGARHNLIAVGLLLTVIADTFLCLLDSFGPSDTIDACGFALFTAAEIVYAIYIGHSNEKFAITVVFWAMFVGVLFGLDMLDIKTCLAVANLSMLTVNMVTAWPWLSQEKTLYRWLFAIGLLLFFGCDYSIMFRTLFAVGTVQYEIARFMVWLCYVPSQFLLLMSYRFAFSGRCSTE